MKNAKLHLKYLESELHIEDENEKKQIAFMILDHLYQLDRNAILLEKQFENNPEKEKKIIERLNKNEPVQYIFGESHFYGHMFKVDANVLIPRPETEELVYKIIQRHNRQESINILDIGTGSGCIPITLKLELPQAEVSSIDISKGALKIASENADKLSAKINFLNQDILNYGLDDFSELDIIVSNPPYVTNDEKKLMANNVLDFEPELALFVPDQNPLIFYKRITELAAAKLKTGGWLYFEINEQYGKDMEALLADFGFKNIFIIEDMQGKQRHIEGQKI
ncbi:peptide chain release factor N(5)-glutamine methyltransferase [Sediminitomix flava]|uniref:peptide chain release factor N(5)-glutamine methyltransferase n=1 Tax=Sediminitomix flava TaxID=379075 RepID=A0A315Z7T1_SEDFL|nr:peptide chain release factor N(5)-glutamine methyltransferase [Sediminitomix flava]PWJ40214.1 release factor glutamine methyltransferase [Sediminitomix flava]